jgi:putative tryptophan/tyrosine transport system substrate-binding protein
MPDLRRRNFIALLGGAAAAGSSPLAAHAQQAEHMRRIGLLISGGQDDPEVPANIGAFKQELQKLGWREGRDVGFDVRFASADPERMRSYAAELATSAPDAILTSSNQATSILGRHTRTIPIVFASAGDALGTGLIANMAHPGGNITGFTNYEISIGGKFLELLKEVAPRLDRAAVLYTPGGPAPLEVLRTIEAVAPSLGMKTFAVPGRDPAEIDRAIEAFSHEANGGVIVLSGPSITNYRNRIFSLAARHRLPAIYPYRFYATEGGLMSYGTSLIDQYRRAAGYVDRILKGEKPADLPVQAPTKYELVINLKTARALGLDMPPTLIARADEVIE